jgi:glutamate-1-semialdehyde 2,1-aminomutase
MIGGGFPVGAIGGRADVMRVFDPNDKPPPLPHSGTFSANPVTMVAGLAAMTHFDEPAVDRLNALGERARTQLREAIKIANVEASVTGAGSMFRLHLKGESPKSYRDTFTTSQESARFERLLRAFERKGILLIGTGTGMLSTPMGAAEVDRLSSTMLEALRQI